MTSFWLSGYVVSDDRAGNFYKELYVQDQAENSTKALRLILNQTALYTQFPVGQKITVRLNGLGAGKQNGVLSLGSYRPQGVGSIANHLPPGIVQRTAEQAVLVPKSIIASEVNEAMLGQWVQLENLQLLKSETAKTFAGEAFDRFNGERPLRSCSDGRSLWLSSSVFADFKSV